MTECDLDKSLGDDISPCGSQGKSNSRTAMCHKKRKVKREGGSRKEERMQNLWV